VIAKPRSFLVIQTAFIGDVILATAVVEKLHKSYPDSSIDFLLRKGNESLLNNHPHLREVLIWDKKNRKVRNLFRLISIVRNRKYDTIINIHRFASSGMITALSGAPDRIGFKKNPWSFAFTQSIAHDLNTKRHEIDRNQKLIESITDKQRELPKLYPSPVDFDTVSKFKLGKYLCVAPTSVWFTKQYPATQWVEFINSVPMHYDRIYLLGAASDTEICESIRKATASDRVYNLAGQLSFLESASLMKDAVMNYVNDSAPMHLASAMNAPVSAIFCSTVPAFGFGPLSDKSVIIESKEKLTCRPCGLHGHKACPQKHFKCATTIETQILLDSLK